MIELDGREQEPEEEFAVDSWDDSEVFSTYREAVDYASELADELDAEGWATDRSWASQSNMYAIRATKGEKTRDIQVNRV